jgi:hypothetical protein
MAFEGSGAAVVGVEVTPPPRPLLAVGVSLPPGGLKSS